MKTKVTFAQIVASVRKTGGRPSTAFTPKTRKVNFCPPNRYLLIATDKKQELGQQVRDTNFLVKDTHRKIAESHS